MQISSPAFEDNQQIPDKYTCKGEGISPPLFIKDIPDGTQSLVLYVHDPDAPNGDFTHWTVWNISPATTIVKEGSVPDSGMEGVNDFGKTGWGAPCPPSDTHRYVFELYALNKQLNLDSGAHAYALTAIMQEHTMAQAQLTGTVSA